MAEQNLYDQFDAPVSEPAAPSRSFNIYDAITPETVQESLKEPTGALDKPRVSFTRESVEGMKEMGEGIRGLGAGYPYSLGRAGGGLLRFVGAPAAPALDWLGRTAGTTLQDLLERGGLKGPGLGGTISAGAAATADALAQMLGISGGQAALRLPGTLKNALLRIFPEYKVQKAAIEHLGKTAERAKDVAKLARERAMIPAEQAALLEEQLPGTRETARRAAIEAEATPVTTARFPEARELTQAAPGSALARKKEAGEFFGGAVARERQKAQSLFEQSYGEVRRGATGIEYDTIDIVATTDDILKGAGLARKIQPTKAEALAGRTKAVLLPEGAEATIAEAETVGRQAALPNSTLEGIIDSLTADSKTATFNDLQVLRSRTRGAIRGFETKGDFDTARRLKPLEAAYTDTIESGLPEKLVENLRTADELYAKEFIPKFGFESPASKLSGAASEDVIANLFPTKGRKEGVTTPALTKSAVGKGEWDRLSSTFWQQEILEPSVKNHSMDFKEVQRRMARYKPETLAEATGYKEIKSIVDRFSEAEQLSAKEIAGLRLRSQVKSEAALSRFKSLEEALAGKKKEITQAGKEIKTAEGTVASVQKAYEQLTGKENLMTQTVLRDFASKARWVGAAGMLYPAMRASLTVPQFVSGVGLLITGEQMYRLMASPTGRSVVLNLMRASGRTASTVVEAQKLGVIYRGLVGKAPEGEGNEGE